MRRREFIQRCGTVVTVIAANSPVILAINAASAQAAPHNHLRRMNDVDSRLGSAI